MKTLLLSGGLVLLLGLGGHVSHAAPPIIMGSALVDGWQWAVSQSFDLPGARLSQQSFQTDDSPAQAARRIVARPDTVFDRLSIIRGHIVLSGLQDGAHWLAWLRASARGTRGMLSVLRPASADGIRLAVPLPEGVIPLTQVFQQEGKTSFSLSSHEYLGMPDHLQTAARHALRRAGWHPAESVWPDAEAWRYRGASLHLGVRRQDGRSILWTLVRDGETP